ncbi:MAG: lauroyl acyltransferase [Pseudorhodobacter sp.]|nr:MAG: lauroyl acyltransferase [Pseudorhodobacter sp.]
MQAFGSKISLAGDWLVDRMIRLLIGLALMLPYRFRGAVFGWCVAWVMAPLAGYRRRIRANLALIFPQMPRAEVARMMRAVPANIGRTFIEIYSGDDFKSRVARAPLQGPGVAALQEAAAAKRPVILVTGHIGNYDAVRAALIARGYPVGGLYKRMNNPFFNAHYVTAISRIGTPVFARGRNGMAEMLRFLKGGGMVGIVLDQYVKGGTPIRFLGHDAVTSLSPAEMALRYDALIVPVYGIRRADGDFELLVGAPVPHSDPLNMTKILTSDLEKQVLQHMDQWMWTHRRWKSGKHG